MNPSLEASDGEVRRTVEYSTERRSLPSHMPQDLGHWKRPRSGSTHHRSSDVTVAPHRRYSNIFYFSGFEHRFELHFFLGTMAPKKPQGKGKGQASDQSSNPPARNTRQSRQPRISSSSSSEEEPQHSSSSCSIPVPLEVGGCNFDSCSDQGPSSG